MENDENKKNPKSEKFYQMKISVLERELAEKTRILEKTSSALSDSQKQYQNLLNQFKKIKNKTETEARYNFNQYDYRDDSEFIFNAMKSRQTNSNFGRPLQQLQDFEGTVKTLASQMNKLKSQNNYFFNEQKEWNNFSISIFNRIKNILHFDQEFPEDDSEAQRFILDDMIKRLSSNYHQQKEEENKYHDKYKQAKAKLFEVQKKCDRMLALLEESGIDYQVPKYARKRENIYNKHKNRNYCIEQNGENFDINALGNHLNQLSTITKQMKKHYTTMYETSE